MTVLTFNANCTSEHGESPEEATVDFTPELEARIREMMALCTAHGLSEVREWNCAAVWGGGEDFPEFRTEVDELVVTSLYFWFSSAVKYCDYCLETNMIQLKDVLEGIEKGVTDFTDFSEF